MGSSLVVRDAVGVKVSGYRCFPLCCLEDPDGLKKGVGGVLEAADFPLGLCVGVVDPAASVDAHRVADFAAVDAMFEV